MRQRSLLAIVTAAALALTGCSSTTKAAESSAAFPAAGTKIEWIVPSAPGGANDILARIVGPAMQAALGEASVSVVNKEGGGQVIGLDYAAGAEPTGETIVYTNLPSIFGRYLDPSKNAKFDRSSFTPIGSFAVNSVVIGVSSSSPYNTIEELFAAVKAQPGAVTVGTDSRAGDDHVNLRILEDSLGLDFNIVHYDSGADKITAAVSGEIDFALGGIGSFFGQYKAGDLKLLTVVQEKANPFIPEVPTLTSAGFTVDPMTNDFAISVPSATPAATVAALEAALKAAVTDPAVKAKIEATAAEAVFVSGADIAKQWEEREAIIKPVIEELLKEQG